MDQTEFDTSSPRFEYIQNGSNSCCFISSTYLLFEAVSIVATAYFLGCIK